MWLNKQSLRNLTDFRAKIGYNCFFYFLTFNIKISLYCKLKFYFYHNFHYKFLSLMKKLLLTKALFIFSLAIVNAQVYEDDFTNDASAPVAPYWSGTGGLAISQTAGSGATTITGNGTSGAYAGLSYLPYDNPEMGGTGTQITAVNMSGANNVIYIIAKSSVAGTLLRVDVKDASNYVSNAGTISNQNSLTTAYATYTYTYTTPQDGGYGGTGCAAGPCTVDLTTIKEFVVFVNAAAGGFNGTVDIALFQVGGTAPTCANAPTANAGNDQTVCTNNAAVTLNGSVTVAAGGIWGTSGTGTFSPNSVTLNATYTPSAADIAAGIVTLTLTTTGNGTCNSVSDAMLVTINTCTGMMDASESGLIKIFPNPSSGDLTISTDVSLGNVNVEVINIIGEVVMSEVLTGSSPLDMDDLQKGFYFVKFTSDKSEYLIEKVIVE